MEHSVLWVIAKFAPRSKKITLARATYYNRRGENYFVTLELESRRRILSVRG